MDILSTLFTLLLNIYSEYIPWYLTIFFGLAIVYVTLIIITKNWIVSVLFCLFTFISGYLMCIEVYFISTFYLCVYMGAVSILFLSIFIFINVRTSEIENEPETSNKYSKSGLLIDLLWLFAPASVLLLFLLELLLFFLEFFSPKLLYLHYETTSPYIEGHQWYWNQEWIDFLNDDYEKYIEYDDCPNIKGSITYSMANPSGTPNMQSDGWSVSGFNPPTGEGSGSGSGSGGRGIIGEIRRTSLPVVVYQADAPTIDDARRQDLHDEVYAASLEFSTLFNPKKWRFTDTLKYIAYTQGEEACKSVMKDMTTLIFRENSSERWFNFRTHRIKPYDIPMNDRALYESQILQFLRKEKYYVAQESGSN